MSKVEGVQYICPTCQTAGRMTLWEVIDSKGSPALRRQLLAGEVNRAVCCKCSNSVTPSSDLLYHDPVSKFMIWLQLPYRALKQPVVPIPAKNLADYDLRIVRTHEELNETLRMLEAKLCDTALLSTRRILWLRCHRDFPDTLRPFKLSFHSLLESPETDETFLCFIGDTPTGLKVFSLPYSEYQLALDRLKQRSGVFAKGQWVVHEAEWLLHDLLGI